MTDDFVAGGILPVDDATPNDGEFDPDAVESDVFLDDPQDELLADEDLAAVVSDEDSESLEENV